MIKGPIIPADVNPEEPSEEQIRELWYDHILDEFEGVEGHLYGIQDDLYGLGKLIHAIGTTIEKEEQEFHTIEKEEFEPDISQLSDRVLAAWHKKTFRQFTYKSLLMLIHTTFENGLFNLYNSLVDEQRVAHTLGAKASVIDIVKALKGLDPEIPQLIDRVRGFNFVRNRLAHEEGYFSYSMIDQDAFKKEITGRPDIEISEVTGQIKINKHAVEPGQSAISYRRLVRPRGGKNRSGIGLHEKKVPYTHFIKITRSSFLYDYLALIKKLFELQVKGARKLSFNVINA